MTRPFPGPFPGPPSFKRSPLSISYSSITFETSDQPYTVEGAELISVDDANDTGLAEYELTLEIGSPGTITLSQTTGLSFTTGDGTADTIMTFSGTIANINAALDGLIIDDMTESSDPLTVLLANTTTSDEITRLVPIEVTAPTSNVTPSVEYLVVGGGGGGGGMQANAFPAGGGGAGGYRTATGYAVSAGSPITVTVGGGGAGGGNGANGTKGDDSVFGTITAEGGGYGARGLATFQVTNGGNGGSGGGGCRLTGTGGTASNSNAGGEGSDSASSYGSGGGGGAGAAGTAGSGTNGGAGGVGLNWNSLGTFYAGGGGGGCFNLASGNTGGNGGGGAGGRSDSVNGSNGTANTGGGGGGAGGTANSVGGNGGSGIVIIRYADTYDAAASTTGSPSVTTSGGYRYYTFTASGSITF